MRSSHEHAFGPFAGTTPPAFGTKRALDRAPIALPARRLKAPELSAHFTLAIAAADLPRPEA